MAFDTVTVHHCAACKVIRKVPIECSHANSRPVKMMMENGRFQIKMFCLDCRSIHGNALRHDEFTGVELQVRTFANYHRFKDQRFSLEQEKIDEYIDRLNFPDYHQIYLDYLKTEKWGRLAGIVMQRDNYTCQICGNKAEHVHHLTYKHLQNEFYFELVSLCARCHKLHYHDHD